VAPERVIALAQRAAALGVNEVAFADTIGVAVPTQVTAVLEGAREVTSGVLLGVHLHNTRNTGFANAVAALDAGATVLDASVGGAGGCPFAPKATGNIATEDLVYLLDNMGVSTGVDARAVVTTALWLEERLGRRLPGMVKDAGLDWYEAAA
jgi:isopropylmalate/homocitrate/citramalate synthase